MARQRKSYERKSYGGSYGSIITLKGQKYKLHKHECEFSVIGTEKASEDMANVMMRQAKSLGDGPRVKRLGPKRQRVRVDKEMLEPAMQQLRQDHIAHHIYLLDNGEEILLDDKVILELYHENTGLLESITKDFKLGYEGRMGEAHLLRLSNGTGLNPLKLANKLSKKRGVKHCEAALLIELAPQVSDLFKDQWYLDSLLGMDPKVLAGSDIVATGAWRYSRGDAEVVVAILDDGFDLGHPSLREVKRHPLAFDFADKDTNPEASALDFHGTSVASLIFASHSTTSALRGVAPLCSFLPLRFSHQMAGPTELLEMFRYASRYADVLNISLAAPPSSIDRLSDAFRQEVKQLCQNGGRRHKGLVMVFSAGNYDAPSYLEAKENKQGLAFAQAGRRADIPQGQPIISSFATLEGSIIVAAMSSYKRKAGYSNWGKHISLCGPSDNNHPMAQVDASFIADYSGQGIISAIKRSDLNKPDDAQPLYRRDFGGTSAATPLISGVAALMISVNPNLNAEQVKAILEATADKNLDSELDLKADPNLQGLSGMFDAKGHSLFFGAGKVNAQQAVARARDIFAASQANPHQPSIFEGSATTANPNGSIDIENPKPVNPATNDHGTGAHLNHGLNGVGSGLNGSTNGNTHLNGHGNNGSVNDSVINDSIPNDFNGLFQPSIPAELSSGLRSLEERIAWFPSPNRYNGRQGFKPEAIIIGYLPEHLLTLRQRYSSINSGASSHFAIGNHGEIERYVIETDTAFAYKHLLNPSWQGLKLNSVNAIIDPNLYSLAISLAAGANASLISQSMLDSLIDLIQLLSQRWSLPLSSKYILTAKELNSKAFWPPSFKLETLLDMVKGQHLATKSYQIKKGDTLFSIAKRFNSDVAGLLSLNPQIVNPTNIMVGQVLNIPT